MQKERPYISYVLFVRFLCCQLYSLFEFVELSIEISIDIKVQKLYFMTLFFVKHAK